MLYMWFERVLYADYNYKRNVVIRSIYMIICSSFNHLYNARVEVNEAAEKCKSLLWLQSPTLNVWDLIQNNGKIAKI